MSSTWLCTAHTRCLTPHRAEQAMAFPCQPSTVTGSDRALGITRLLICPQASQACSREPGAQSPSRQVSAQATVAQMGSAAPPPPSTCSAAGGASPGTPHAPRHSASGGETRKPQQGAGARCHHPATRLQQHRLCPLHQHHGRAWLLGGGTCWGHFPPRQGKE